MCKVDNGWMGVPRRLNGAPCCVVYDAESRVGKCYKVVEVSGAPVSSWEERKTSAGKAERQAEDVRYAYSKRTSTKLSKEMHLSHNAISHSLVYAGNAVCVTSRSHW